MGSERSASLSPPNLSNMAGFWDSSAVSCLLIRLNLNSLNANGMRMIVANSMNESSTNSDCLQVAQRPVGRMLDSNSNTKTAQTISGAQNIFISLDWTFFIFFFIIGVQRANG